MRILADTNVPEEYVSALRGDGHEVTYSRNIPDRVVRNSLPPCRHRPRISVCGPPLTQRLPKMVTHDPMNWARKQPTTKSPSTPNPEKRRFSRPISLISEDETPSSDPRRPAGYDRRGRSGCRRTDRDTAVRSGRDRPGLAIGSLTVRVPTDHGSSGTGPSVGFTRNCRETSARHGCHTRWRSRPPSVVLSSLRFERSTDSLSGPRE